MQPYSYATPLPHLLPSQPRLDPLLQVQPGAHRRHAGNHGRARQVHVLPYDDLQPHVEGDPGGAAPRAELDGPPRHCVPRVQVEAAGAAAGPPRRHLFQDKGGLAVEVQVRHLGGGVPEARVAARAHPLSPRGRRGRHAKARRGRGPPHLRAHARGAQGPRGGLLLRRPPGAPPRAAAHDAQVRCKRVLPARRPPRLQAPLPAAHGRGGDHHGRQRLPCVPAHAPRRRQRGALQPRRAAQVRVPHQLGAREHGVGHQIRGASASSPTLSLPRGHLHTFNRRPPPLTLPCRSTSTSTRAPTPSASTRRSCARRSARA